MEERQRAPNEFKVSVSCDGISWACAKYVTQQDIPPEGVSNRDYGLMELCYNEVSGGAVLAPAGARRPPHLTLTLPAASCAVY